MIARLLVFGGAMVGAGLLALDGHILAQTELMGGYKKAAGKAA